ncbi:hypothetical protein BGX34_009670 [Mortierella sp. NVP85]|nr:hypothetical protein BGX34_009670 [Mortierella sp. NVP85]
MDQYTTQPPAAAVASQSAVSVSAPGAAAAASLLPDETSKSLYVGNLDQNVNEPFLQEFFSQCGPVENVKIIRDRNGGLNYGFVEFADHATAAKALQTMNGRRVLLQEIKVNWAFTGQTAGKEETGSNYHIFIGDLSPEVNDDALGKAFGVFGAMTEARVMWDTNTGKSRGYGFAAFKERADAERAIATMNGQILGSRAVRCNWASQRGVPGPTYQHHGAPYHHGGGSFKAATGQAPQLNTTVYVGNLPPQTTQEDLVPFFQPFGMIMDLRLQADRGFAFVKLETHEKAANAISRLAGAMINGRPAKLSWGKDRNIGETGRGNHYGYYNNGTGYHMGAHQNNGGYPYQYNSSNSNNNHYGGNGQGYGRNGPHHHHHHNQHHHNQHHNQHYHQQHHHNNHHHMGHHSQHAFQHHQHMQQPIGGLDGVPGATGSSALAAGSSALPPVNVAISGNNGSMSQEAYDQFANYNSSTGGSR